MCVVFLPNVGGAIVADEAGITRDRTYRPAEFLGEHFQVVDTGGLVFEDNDDIFSKDIRDQAMIAIDEACAVILVTDGMVGLTQMDIEVSAQGRKLTRYIPNAIPKLIGKYTFLLCHS